MGGSGSRSPLQHVHRQALMPLTKRERMPRKWNIGKGTDGFNIAPAASFATCRASYNIASN